MPLPLRLRTRALVVGIAIAALGSALPATQPAVADPVADARAKAAAAASAAAAARTRVAVEEARITSVQRQMQALHVSAEIAAEAYNAAVERLRWADSVAGAAQNRLAAATAALQGLRTRAGAVAVQAYQTGGLAQFALLTDADGPATLLDREATLRAVAHAQRNSLAELAAARHEQAFAKAAADDALARQRELTAAKRRERDVMLAAARRQQQLLGQLQEAQARLVAAAQAAMTQANAAKNAVDAAVAARALAIAQARAAALARQRAAQAAAAAAFRAASAAEAAEQAAEQRRQIQARQIQARQSESRPSQTRQSESRPSETRQLSPTSDPAERDLNPPASPEPTQLGSGGAAVAVRWAYLQIGKPYVWAADGPDTFDCSGLTQYVWGKAGVYLPHYSGAQINSGRPVSQSELIPGDLVFFGSPIHHVGIYVGGGNMINAPHTGALVREEPVWWPQYVGAARPS